MDQQEMDYLDAKERAEGRAMHQHIASDTPKKVWRKAAEDELQTKLNETDFDGDPWSEPNDDELQSLRQFGMLPPGRGGRKRTIRAHKEWGCKDMSNLECRLKDEIKLWTADFNWVPRPMATGEKFFLVFFSGHRRWGDISSWFHWEGTVTPVAIDLAVSKNHGDMMQHGAVAKTHPSQEGGRCTWWATLRNLFQCQMDRII